MNTTIRSHAYFLWERTEQLFSPYKRKKIAYVSANIRKGHEVLKQNSTDKIPRTFSLWSPPTILMLRMWLSSSRSSNLSVLVVAGSPDFTSTSLRVPISRFPFKTHLLTKGLYLCGWSNLLTRDHTWRWNIPIQHRMKEIIQ